MKKYIVDTNTNGNIPCYVACDTLVDALEAVMMHDGATFEWKRGDDGYLELFFGKNGSNFTRVSGGMSKNQDDELAKIEVANDISKYENWFCAVECELREKRESDDGAQEVICFARATGECVGERFATHVWVC